MSEHEKERQALLKRVKQANLERLKELREKKKNNTLRGIEYEEFRMLKSKYKKQ